MAQIIALCRNSLVLCLLASLALSVALASFSPANAEQLKLDGISDPAIVNALERGNNLPALLTTNSASSLASEAERVALIASQIERLADIMKSFGYLDARIRVENATDPTTPDAWLIPEPGPLYRLAIIELAGIGKDTLSDVTKTQIQDYLDGLTGSVASEKAISRIESEILWRIRLTTDPTAHISGRTLTVDRELNMAHLQITLSVRQPTQFGPVAFFGASAISRKALTKLAPFSEGDRFSRAKLAAFAQTLQSLGLFSLVQVGPAQELDPLGRIPVNVTLNEKPFDAAELAHSTPYGALVMGFVLIFIALRQTLIAGFGPLSVIRKMDLILFVLVAGSVVIAIIRLTGMLKVTLIS